MKIGDQGTDLASSASPSRADRLTLASPFYTFFLSVSLFFALSPHPVSRSRSLTKNSHFIVATHTLPEKFFGNEIIVDGDRSHREWLLHMQVKLCRPLACTALPRIGITRKIWPSVHAAFFGCWHFSASLFIFLKIRSKKD